MSGIDFTGRTKNWLTAIRRTGTSAAGASMWEFRCACGIYKTIRASSVFYDETTKSCGCKRGAGNKTHGATNTFEFRAWTAMKARCYRKTHKYYKHYGGRGIEICPQWKSDFSQFLKDMGLCPYGGAGSVERKDPNGNYEPENCTWLLRTEQPKNTRKTVRIEGCTIAQIAARVAFSRSTIWVLIKNGKSLEEILAYCPQKIYGGKHALYGRS